MSQEGELRGSAGSLPPPLSTAPIACARVCLRQHLCRLGLQVVAFPRGALPSPAPGVSRKVWLRGPDGGCLRWGGDDVPSVRKPFSSVPRGCLGVPDPPAAAPPLEARSVAASSFGHSVPSGSGFEGPSDDGDTQLSPLPYLPWPAPPPSESGEGPAVPGPASVAWKRCAALRCAYVRACLPRFARSGPRVREKEGALVGGAEAFPVPRCCPLPRLVRAALRRPLPLRVRSRRGLLCAQARSWPGLSSWGRSARDASLSPPPARVVAGGRANERMVDGRLEEAAAASLWRLCLLFEGSACAVLPRWRGFPGARAAGGTASRSCALGGTGPASRASRGRPVCLWRWDPRVVYPVARPGPVPCLGARSRSLRPGVLPLVC